VGAVRDHLARGLAVAYFGVIQISLTRKTQALKITIMTTAKLKRGDVREDGKVFWLYQKACKDGEYWISPEKFNLYSKREKQRSISRVLPLERPLKCGDIREDGKVFWAYNKTCTNSENWITREKFEERKSRHNDDENKLKRAKYNKLRNADQKNKQHRNARRKIQRINNPIYAITSRLRTTTNQIFRRKGFGKNSKTAELLGCTWEHLLTHIESQFKEGMSWDNRHFFEIDHIIPLASATTQEELIRLCHFSNLQPLFVNENRSKGDKISIFN
jgi:hypothetical protein